MKKLLFTAALVAATSSFAAEDTFYITGAAGMSKPTKYKINDTKIKPKIAFIGEIGAGYNVTDSTRAELVFTKHFDSKAKISTANEITPGVNLNTDNKITVNANAIMARVSQDVYNYGFGKFFVTGGLGIARVQEKINASFSIPTANIHENINKITLKSKNNFAYNIAAGTSFEVQENVMLDLSLAYTDFGKVKSKKIKRSEVLQKNSNINTALNALGLPDETLTFKGKNLRAVSVKAGIRVNL